MKLEEYNELKLKIIELDKLDKLKKIISESKRLEMSNKIYKYHLSKMREKLYLNKIFKSISLDSVEDEADVFNFSDNYDVDDI